MENKSGKTLATISLILGIVSVVLCWFFGLISGVLCLICGIVAIVLAVKGKKANIAAGEPTGMATAGLVLGIIGVVLSGLTVICAAACGAALCAAAGTIQGSGIESDLQDIINSIQ